MYNSVAYTISIAINWTIMWLISNNQLGDTEIHNICDLFQQDVMSLYFHKKSPICLCQWEIMIHKIYYSHGQPNPTVFISHKKLMEIFLFQLYCLWIEKRSWLWIFSEFIDEKVGFTKILRPFSELFVPLFGFQVSKLTLALKSSHF